MRSIAIFILLCLTAGSVGAISMTDYQVPVSRATSAFGGFQYNYAFKDSTTADNGNLFLNFNQFFSSLPTGYSLGFDGIVNRDGLAPRGRDKYSYNASAFAQGNKYLREDSNLFGFGRLDGAGATAYDRPALALTVGVGYGRFINATPLARALRAEEELLKEKVLTGVIPDKVVLDVAKRMAPEVIARYGQEYDYWERYYYGDLEKEFQKSGKLRDNELGSVGTLVIRDVLREFISDRYYGYEFSAGMGYDLQTSLRDQERRAFIEGNANVAYPINLRSQFVEFLRLRSPLTDGKFGREVHLSFKPTYSYEISDALDLVASYVLAADRADVEGERSSVRFGHQLMITAAYFIANRIDFTSSLNFSKPHDIHKVATQFSSGLTYRLR
jgi:hypothetical protein